MERWMFLITLMIFSLPVHNCIEVITSERNERPQVDGHFVIPGLNLSSLDTFTMCGRFNIYQFIVHSEVDSGKYQYKERHELIQGIFPGFTTYSLVHCDDNFCPFITPADRKWKHVYVWTWLYSQSKTFPSSLKPNTWNSLCLKVTSTSTVIKLNGEEFIIHKNDNSGSAFSDYGNYRFMNDPYHKVAPMYGAITDLNVWNRILSEEESENWMNCTIQTEGDVFSWQNSSQHIQLTGLKKISDSLDNICFQNKSSHLMVGNEALNFEETLNFCNDKIGNKVVISSKETAHKVNKTMNLFAPDSRYVYTGHTDVEVEGRWVVHGTQQEMAWKNWKKPNQPNNWAGIQNCATMLRDNLQLQYDDKSCMTRLVPVCNLAEVC